MLEPQGVGTEFGNAINALGTLTLDNSGTNVNNRLGGGGLFLTGRLNIIGNAAGTSETVSTTGNDIQLRDSGSVLTLDANGGAEHP